MSLKHKLLYLFLSVIMVVSFQNCGQSGAIGVSGQEVGKVSNPGTGLIDISDDSDGSDVQNPPVDDNDEGVKPPVVVSPPKDDHTSDIKDDKDTDDIVDSDDDGNIRGMKVACSDLLRVRTDLIPVSSKVDIKNVRTFWMRVKNKDEVSVENYRGMLMLENINTISKVQNIRSLFLGATAKSIKKIENARALSLISAESIDSISNFRGLGCFGSANLGEIENFRGILEVRGNVKLIKNFRGILNVVGNVEKIENFRGILIVGGKIGFKKDVKVRQP